MELLIGAVISILTQVYKKLASKLGQDTTNIIIYLGIFVLCVIWAYITQKQLISVASLHQIGLIFASAIAFYEVVMKWLLGNVLKIK